MPQHVVGRLLGWHEMMDVIAELPVERVAEGAVTAEATAPSTAGVEFLDLTRRMCRYPLNGMNATVGLFCGEVIVAPGRPYCATHHARCYRPAPKRF